MEDNSLPNDQVSNIPIPEVTPELPLKPKKTTSPILPMLLGFFVVIIISSVLAAGYYFAKLKKEVASSANTSPTPSPVLLEPSSSPEPSIEATASPTTVATSKTTPKPSPLLTVTPTNTPAASTPTSTTLDIRYGNPSVHVKQTYDDGMGDGRVINREYSSLQVGEFDELKSSWEPRVTSCFHIISNQNIAGSLLGYTITVDDQVSSEGTLSQYETLEAGKIYDLCYDSTILVGTHTVKMTINNTHSLNENNYNNNLARVDYKNIADNIPPNFTLIGPTDEGDDGTCLVAEYISDNVTPVAQLKLEQKIDDQDWSTYSGSKYCFVGESGQEHTYSVRLTDNRLNINKQDSTFTLF